MQFKQRPDNALTTSSFERPLSPKDTRRILAYLLRSTLKRITKESVGEHRYMKLAGELASQLIPLVTRNQSCLGFYTDLCVRFGVDATGSGTPWGPIEVWLPEGHLRWDKSLLIMDYALLRTIVEESPEFLATFARSHGDDSEDGDFNLFPDPVIPSHVFKPELPTELITPRGFQAIWTLTSPIHHGADFKSGNVNLFRRQDICDPASGKVHQVPFISGNSIRGQWRDLVMCRWLQLLGVTPTELPPLKAHALLAGGSVEQGSDGAQVNNGIRKAARDLCPPIDLLGGNIDQQIMSGRVRVGDAVLVCRENAWIVRSCLNSDLGIEAFAQSLPEAPSMTEIRQGVRSRHPDLEGGAGVQMLFNQEVIMAGYQMVHSFQLWAPEGVSQVTASCLNDLVLNFQQLGKLGASTSRGFGGIAFAGYNPTPGTPLLPSPDLYLETVTKRREEMLEWLLKSSTAEKQPKKGSKKGVASNELG